LEDEGVVTSDVSPDEVPSGRELNYLVVAGLNNGSIDLTQRDTYTHKVTPVGTKLAKISGDTAIVCTTVDDVPANVAEANVLEMNGVPIAAAAN